MNPKNHRILNGLVCVALVASLSAVVGCRSPGYTKNTAAASRMQTAAEEVQAENHALEVTIAALNDLVERPAPDLRLQYRSYCQALDHLNSTVSRTEASGNKMRKRNAAYLKAWDENLTAMTFDHVRQSSEARKAEVSAQLEQIDTRYNEASSAVQPLVAYLKDIRRALDADLTPAGMGAVKPIVSNAAENAEKVRTALGRLSEELASSSNRISPVTVQTASAQATPAPVEAAPLGAK